MVKRILAKTYVYFILFLLYLPILVLMVFSFTSSKNVGTWTNFTFDLYINLFKNKEIMTALGNTVLIAVVSAVISTILGTLGAIGVFYSKPKAKSVMEGLTQVPVINAEIVMAVSLVVLFLALHIDKGFFTLVIGHVVLTIAFVYLSVKPKLQQMDPNTYEAALDLGATPTRALFKVIIPEILPGIISGFMLALTLSLDDFLITAYTRSSSYETLSTFVQAAIKKSSIPVELRALTTLIFLVAVGIVLINNFRDTKQNKKYHSMRKGEK